MSEPAELNERVTRLEREVRAARQDAAAARILAGGADRDVSEMRTELRAHTGSLKALRDTQVEQGKVLANHGKRLDRLETKVDTGFARMDDRFAEMDRRFAEVEGEMRRGLAVLAAGQQKITDLLTDRIDDEGRSG